MLTDRERIEEALRSCGNGGLVYRPFDEVDAHLADVVDALLPLLDEVRREALDELDRLADQEDADGWRVLADRYRLGARLARESLGLEHRCTRCGERCVTSHVCMAQGEG